MAKIKSKKVTKIKLSIMPKSHAYLQTMTKSLQDFKLIGIKLYEELRTQGTHPLFSNALVENNELLRIENPNEKATNTGPLIFHADDIYEISGP